jgi:putative oxidoreductase
MGGVLTMLGLGLRFVSIPMIINMVVAIISVKLKNVSGLDDFVELDEPLYALTFVWLLFSGAGWLSVDGLLKQALGSRLPRRRAPAAVPALTSEIRQG